MNTTIIKSGDEIQLSSYPVETLPSLPVGNWLLQVDAKGSFFLKKQRDFVLPERLYGNLDATVNRFLNTFNKKPGNLGILLTGLKGSGKSLLAKKLCIDSKLPVILITEAYVGTTFQSFLSSITQPCIVLFDEFEKVYKERFDIGNKDNANHTGSQEQLLTLFDGVFMSKKMFVLTSNSTMINDAFNNRPGRIHYKKDYDGLDEETIIEIIDDLLINKANKEELLNTCRMLMEINMDQLHTIIWEMNNYNETSKQVISLLNIQPAGLLFTVEFSFIHNGKRLTFNGDRTINNPLQEGTIWCRAEHSELNKLDKSIKDEIYSEYLHELDYTIDSFSKISYEDGCIVIKDSRHEDLIIKCKKAAKFNSIIL